MAKNQGQFWFSRTLGSGRSAPHLRKLPRKTLRRLASSSTEYGAPRPLASAFALRQYARHNKKRRKKLFQLSPSDVSPAQKKPIERVHPQNRPPRKRAGDALPLQRRRRVCRFRLHSGIELCQHSVVLHEIARTEGELDVQQILVCGGPSGHKLENRLAESEF